MIDSIAFEDKTLKKFTIIWFGQFISILGSGISSFGLSVWLFNKTGSATPFAISFLCSILPAIIFAPFAGSFADRKTRKSIIILTDTLDSLLKLLMLILLYLNLMDVWIVYIILFTSSTLSTFQGPAFNSSIPQLVPKKYLNRANGMLQFSYASQNMLAPVLAGILFPFINLNGLIAIDFVTFLVAICIIAFSKIPQPEINPSLEEKGKNTFSIALDDLKFSWNYLSEKKGFISLFISFSILNLIANFSLILVGPLILSNYNPSIFGSIQAIYGFSMILGSIIASYLPTTNKKVRTIFLLLIISGIGLIISGISSSWYSIALGFFVFFIFVPYANTLLQSLVQIKVDSTILGRVSALINALLKGVTPIACIVSGPLIDNVLEPLMQSNGFLGSSFIGNLIGSGPGRGIGLSFIICGIWLIAQCIIMLLNKQIVNLEEKLPDSLN